MQCLAGWMPLPLPPASGENDAKVRCKCLEGLEHLGIIVDQEVNAGLRGKSGRISTDDSAVEVWVVPTDEEFEIATICKELVM